MSYTYQYPHPAIAADCVVFGYDGKELQLLLIERKNDPCKGMWAFPGGFMEINETAEAAARRELNEETGVEVPALMPFGNFSTVRRDPRERVVSIAYYTVVEPTAATGGDDARMAAWFPIGELPPLAFDHDEMLIKAFLQMWKDISTEPEFWAMPVHPEMTDMLLWHCEKALFSPLLRTAPDLIQSLKPNEIFVFGSNLQGMHGGGAAYIAVKKFGAV
ncbi:MAG: NUDIX domain-containing protein, partial [Bacteroidales bacterium]|nr:NUDIX domain-containing protein [Bacteroidales bacterium]